MPTGHHIWFYQSFLGRHAWDVGELDKPPTPRGLTPAREESNFLSCILNGESSGDQASGMLNFPGICAKVMAYDQRRHRQILTQALPELRRIHRFQCSVRDNRVARQSAEREAPARKLWS